MDTKKTKEKEEFLDESPENDESVEFLDDEFEEDEDEEKSWKNILLHQRDTNHLKARN